MWGNLQPPPLDAAGFMAPPFATGLPAVGAGAPANLWARPQAMPPMGLPPVNTGFPPDFAGTLPGPNFGSAPCLMPPGLTGMPPTIASSSIFGAAVPGSSFGMPHGSATGVGSGGVGFAKAAPSFAKAPTHAANGSCPPADSRVADAAKGVIRSAPTTVPASKAKDSQPASPPAKRAKQIGSLLAAYDESESESEEESKRQDATHEEAGSKPKQVTVVACDWEPWKDVLVPTRRHGLVMGRAPTELVGSWPREVEAYPTGHPPADPPGCCQQQCTCMDGTRRPEEWELRKPWLDSEDWRTQSEAAQKALKNFTGQAFVFARGRNSKQHFLEAVSTSSASSTAPGAQSQAASSRPSVAELRARTAPGMAELETIAELAATAMREALDDIGLENVLGAGVQIPAAALLPPGKLYEPFRVEAANTPATSSKSGLCALGAHVRASGECPVPSGAVQQLRLLFPEGEVVVPACRVGSGGFEAPQRATAQIAKQVEMLPWQFRTLLLEAISGAWDTARGQMCQGIQFKDWLRVMERVHLRARCAASAHVVDLGPSGAEALLFPSASSTAPAPGAANAMGPLGPTGLPLPGWLPPSGLQTGLLPPPPGPSFTLAPPTGFPPGFPPGMELPPGFPPNMELPPGFPPGFAPGMDFHQAGTMPSGPQWKGLMDPPAFESTTKAPFPSPPVALPPGPPPGVPPKMLQRPPGPPPGAPPGSASGAPPGPPPGAPPVSLKRPPPKAPLPPWRDDSSQSSAVLQQEEDGQLATDPRSRQCDASLPALHMRSDAELRLLCDEAFSDTQSDSAMSSLSHRPWSDKMSKWIAAPPADSDAELAGRGSALGLATAPKAGKDWNHSSATGGIHELAMCDSPSGKSTPSI